MVKVAIKVSGAGNSDKVEIREYIRIWVLGIGRMNTTNSSFDSASTFNWNTCNCTWSR
jgi:hypothetical protein